MAFQAICNLNAEHGPLVIGCEYPAARNFARLHLGQGHIRIAEDGVVLFASFDGDQLVALVEEKRTVRCFAHDSGLCCSGCMGCA
jgi:hypothetical protein